MKKTFGVINELESEGVIKSYAMGGATALLFYAEPALTYDIDIFIFLPDDQGTRLIDLGPLYKALADKGYTAKKEHVIIEGIPVQFIPVYNDLVGEAVKKAVRRAYEGMQIRVLKMEYLFAIMIDTNRPKDRERIRKLLDEVKFDQDLLQEILKRHGLKDRWRKCVEAK